jgi:RecA-family ATPase
VKIAAHVTTGEPFPMVLPDLPPQPRFPPQRVCLLAGEDDAADAIRPRLEINDGDAKLLYVLEGWRHADGSRGTATLQDLAMIEQALKRYEPALLVVDPLQAYLGRGLDMNKASDMRLLLADVAALCKDWDTTVMYVRHLSKTPREQAIFAALGSIDISAHVRSAMLVGVDPEDPTRTRRILAHHKSSYGAEAQSLAFTLTAVTREMFRADDSSVMVEAARVDWDGFTPLRADDLLAPRKQDEAQEGQEETNALTQAEEFLQELLQQGPVLYTEVQQAVKQVAISTATLKRAKVRLGVKARKRPQEGIPYQEQPYEWVLPRDTDLMSHHEQP